MNISTKLLKAAAGQGGSASLDVDDVFSTFVADATGSGSLTINNGIDLSEGGIVWVKSRNNAHNHYIFDTNVGSGGYLQPNNTASGLTGANYSFTSTGLTDAYNNYSGNEAVWWTFRNSPMFQCLTYTGNGTAGRTVSHNLGSIPGMFIVKEYGATGENWSVYHRGLGATKTISLNRTNAASDSSNHWNDTAPTSTEFTLGDEAGVNGNGKSFVAYLFAHNNNDGEFGPDGSDIIKCGSYSTNSSADASINLGFEPQWVMFRPYDDTSDWKIIDNMRGFVATPASGNYNKQLAANSSGAEADNDNIKITSTGFEHVSGFASKNFIYMAIRRGPLATPTAATNVFAIDAENSSAPYYTSNFPVDMGIRTATDGSGKFISARITGTNDLRTDRTNSQDSSSGTKWDYMDGYRSSAEGSTFLAWMWKRAPGYFDVCCYSGTGSARTVSHNLDAVPEMMWVKKRNGSKSWRVYHSGIGATKVLYLDLTSSQITTSTPWNDTIPTSSVFTLGSDDGVNGSGNTYIAYLFATVAGVSKVGSWTMASGNNDIDCGFTNGARFVLIKDASASGNWIVWDSVRGIVAGNDPYLELNSTNAEYTTYDYIDPLSSGFTITSTYANFYAGNTYIFYAIA